MDERVKRRLVGAVILASLFVILIPLVLDQGPADRPAVRDPTVPSLPAEPFPAELLRVEDAPPGLAEAPADLPPDGGPFEEPPPDLGPPDPTEPILEVPPPAGKVPGGAGEVPARAAASPGPAPEASPAGEARLGLRAWAVQVGSFTNAANALALRDALRGRGFAAFVERTGEKSTRVYVGPEMDRQEAVAARERLARELGLDGLVVGYPGAGQP